MMSSVSFKQGWLYCCIYLQVKDRKYNYVISSKHEPIIDYICSICRDLNITYWILNGYSKGIYDIYLKGLKKDIDYLLLNRSDNSQFIKGYVSSAFEIKGKVIYTKGWNNSKRKEFYLQVVSSKSQTLSHLSNYLNNELNIQSNYIVDNQVSRVRIYKKDSIFQLSHTIPFINNPIGFSYKLNDLLNKINK